MYRVLIVDDEKMARESTYELLSMIDDIEMEILKAGSAVEAEKVFASQRVDIVILDINMPQMSGLDFYDVIMEKWPYCKAIFLTAYSEFDYVYRVHERAKYVLKADDEQKLLDAFRISVEEIEKEMQLSRAQESQVNYLAMGRTLIGSEYLRDVLDGNIVTESLTDETLEGLGIHLSLEGKIYPVCIRYSGGFDKDFHAKQKSIEIMSQFIHSCFFESNHGGVCYYNRNLVFLFLQPNQKKELENLPGRLGGHAAIFQEAMQKNIDCSITVLISSKGMPFSEVLTSFSSLRDSLLKMEDDAIQMTDDVLEASFFEAERMPEEKKRGLHRMVQNFEYYLDINNAEGAMTILKQITGEMQMIRSRHDLSAIEIYNLISTKLLGMILRMNIQEEIAFQIGIMDLCNVSAHADWGHAFQYLESVVEKIFALRQNVVVKQKEMIIRKIKQYVKENLDGDTSLCALADHVNLSQEYLLRLFKKEEGITILTYVNDKKIAEAKRLLQQEKMQVKEVADRLGFSSSGYFIRFFKEKTGITPHQFQENNV